MSPTRRLLANCAITEARAAVPSLFQSVVFPAAGWERDLYWCTFSTLARVEVVSA